MPDPVVPVNMETQDRLLKHKYSYTHKLRFSNSLYCQVKSALYQSQSQSHNSQLKIVHSIETRDKKKLGRLATRSRSLRFLLLLEDARASEETVRGFHAEKARSVCRKRAQEDGADAPVRERL